MTDHRFSNALFEAASTDCKYWFRSHSSELNYAIRNMTDWVDLSNKFDEAPLLQRQIFLQLAALSMKDEGL